MTIHEKADELIYRQGLLKLLQKYGEVYIVGSYKMGIMTWNDVDFYIDKTGLSARKFYDLASEIVKIMQPGRFDGEFNEEKSLAFLGFETNITGERWNIDIWWKDKAEIDASMAYAQDIAALMCRKPELKEAVIKIKQDLMARGLYGFDKGKKHYHSQEIYDAVFNKGILTTEQLLEL